MFIRTKDVNGHKYHQLVESYREDGRVRQRVLAHLGESATLEEAIERVAAEVRTLQEKRQALLDEREDILRELKEKLPNVMAHHNGVPPRFEEFLSSLQYRHLEKKRYGPVTAVPHHVPFGNGYYDFMGSCGRYHRIPREMEGVDTQIKRAEARLEKLKAAKPSNPIGPGLRAP